MSDPKNTNSANSVAKKSESFAFEVAGYSESNLRIKRSHEPLYKFLNNWDLTYIIDHGSLKFGRLQYYALLEFVTGDDWIGDQKEGNDTGELNGGTDTPERREFLKNSGIAHAEDGTITFENVNYVVRSEGFALCLSQGDIEQLMPEMTKDRKKTNGYDRCLMVTDLHKLIEKIKKGKLSAPYEGQVCENVFNLMFGAVDYSDRTENDMLNTLREPIPNFFRKDNKYKTQSEFRIVLTPKFNVEFTVDAIFVNIENPRDSFIQKYTSKENGDRPPENIYSKEESDSALEFLYRCLIYLKTFKGSSGNLFNQMIARDANFREMASTESVDAELDATTDDEFFSAVATAYWKVRKSGENNNKLDRGVMSGHRTALKFALERFLTEIDPAKYGGPFYSHGTNPDYLADMGMTLRDRKY